MNRLERRLQERRTQIGRRLRDAREAMGLTQGKLSRLVGCSKSHVSQIESATGTYSLKIFLALCDALEEDPSFVFCGVPALDLDLLYLKFDKTISKFGDEAVDFLLSLDPDEVQLLYAARNESSDLRPLPPRRRASGGGRGA